MPVLIDALVVIHVITAVLLAWPFYALVAVNNRGELGPPVGDRTDVYLENVIKNRVIACYVFQATVLITGLALVSLEGFGLSAVVTDPIIGLKFWLLLLLAALLSYVHFTLQPRIDDLFEQGGNPITDDEILARLGPLRTRRKRLAAACLFLVLSLVVFGVEVQTPLPVWLNVVFIAAIAAFTWRAYQSTTPYGWI